MPLDSLSTFDLAFAAADYPRARLELLRLPLDCFGQSEVVEYARTQLRRDSPDGGDRGVGQRDHGLYLLAQRAELRPLPRFRDGLVETFKLPSEARQRRTQLVVNLARDAYSLLFPRRLKARGEGA